MKFKMLGFQDQEATVKLGNEERSVRFWYVSTGGSRWTLASPSTKLQRITSSSKSNILNHLLRKDDCFVVFRFFIQYDRFPNYLH